MPKKRISQDEAKALEYCVARDTGDVIRAKEIALKIAEEAAHPAVRDLWRAYAGKLA